MGWRKVPVKQERVSGCHPFHRAVWAQLSWPEAWLRVLPLRLLCASGSAGPPVSGHVPPREAGPGSPELPAVSGWGRGAAAGPRPPCLSQAAPRVGYKLRGFAEW